MRIDFLKKSFKIGVTAFTDHLPLSYTKEAPLMCLPRVPEGAPIFRPLVWLGEKGGEPDKSMKLSYILNVQDKITQTEHVSVGGINVVST